MKFLNVVPPLIVAVILTAIVLPATANVPATTELSNSILTNNTSATASTTITPAFNVEGQFIVMATALCNASNAFDGQYAELTVIETTIRRTNTRQPEVCLPADDAEIICSAAATQYAERIHFVTGQEGATQRSNSDIKLGGSSATKLRC